MAQAQILHEGDISTVYKAKCLIDQKFYAVKRYSDKMKNNIVNPRYLYMLREIEILKLLDHPLIVNFVDWFRDDENYIYLALHLSEEGSLQQRLETIKTPLNEQEIISLIAHLAITLQYVHSKGITM